MHASRVSKRTVALPLLVVLAFASTGVSWAATNGLLGVDVTPGSSLPTGEVAALTPLAGSFSITQGQAEVVAGVELFRIDLGAARFSDQVKIHVFLTNPSAMPRALDSPTAFIDVAVWYADASGEHVLSDGTTKVIKDGSQSGRITKENGNVVLLPAVTQTSTLYLLAQVTTSTAGRAASQVGLDQVQFFADVRL